MKCKKCSSERIVKNGLRRGKPCFLCKNCGHQFTNETSKYNNYDKCIAIYLYQKYPYNQKVNGFIKTKLRLSHIAKILDHKYTTVHFWVMQGRKDDKKVSRQGLKIYLQNHKNGQDIVGLLFPDKVHYHPSQELKEIIKYKK